MSAMTTVRSMSPLAKIGVVVAGYVGAFALASAAVVVNDAAMDPVTQQSGMAAFGDSLLWLGVFGVCAVPPTGAALFFLRPHPRFWRVLCGIALFIAATGAIAVLGYFVGRTAAKDTALYYWSASSVLRLLLTPLFGLLFLLACVFAPGRAFRLGLLVATLAEVAGFICFVLGLAMSFAG
jgi:hypothetical protein